MNICVYGASSNLIDEKYILAGEKLGEEIAKRGHNLVFGGGTNGLMGAAARGVKRYGGKIIGIAPSFFSADGVLFEDCTELIRTNTMRERKQLLEEKSDAFVMTPGGIGTFEEFFEVLTLKQLVQHSKAIAVLNTDGFFDDLEEVLQNLAAKDFMSSKSLNLYKLFEDPALLVDYIESYIPEKFDINDMKSIGIAK